MAKINRQAREFELAGIVYIAKPMNPKTGCSECAFKDTALGFCMNNVPHCTVSGREDRQNIIFVRKHQQKES